MDSSPEQPIGPDLSQPVEETTPSHELSAQPAEFAPSEPLPVAPPPSLAQKIFFGPFGLRAGWSLLIYFSIFATIAGGLYLVSHRPGAHPPAAKTTQSADAQKDMTVKSAVIGEGIFFVVLLLASWLMAAIERRKFSAFGLGGKNSVARFLVGTFWGLAAMSLLIGLLRAFHLLVFDSQRDHGLAILGWGGAQLIGFLCVGLVEEYLFRGYLQFTLTRGLVGLGNLISPAHGRSIAFWIASVITSVLFFLAHTGNSGENGIGLTLVFCAGVLFLVALWRTGSLWWAIGFHMAWDWAQSFLYGVPDSGGLVQGRLFATHAIGNPMLSGGTDGPEGSLLCIPVIVLAILVLLFLTRPAPQPPLETKESLPRLEPETSMAA